MRFCVAPYLFNKDHHAKYSAAVLTSTDKQALAIS